MFYYLPIGQTVKLANAFGTDAIVVFQSTTVKTGGVTGEDNTSINLLGATGNVILHISFRLFQNAIVFNAKAANGAWGAEETETLANRFVGAQNTVAVYDHGDRFQILIDFHTVHYFTKRFNETATSVSYGINVGQPSLFSDPLAVSTYSSLSKLVANTD